MRSGGRILVDQLRRHGADRVFCVPGESYLAALDALVDVPEIDLVVCRMEAGAANMAEADGKLTGRPGVCFVTRGPGAAHAAVGVHTAFQDSTPLLLLVGQVPRRHRRREAFQEVDVEAMFAPLAKWACEVDDPRRIPELVARAFALAVAGRPGPVVLSVPEDVLAEEADVEDADPVRPPAPAAGTRDLELLRELLAGARRPLVLVGGGVWSAEAGSDLLAFAEASRLPVVTSFRRQAYVDNRSPVYCGWAGVGMEPRVAGLLRSCDVLLALGARLGEATTGGYELLRTGPGGTRLVHVYPEPSELGRVFRPELAVAASPVAVAAALAAQPPLDGSAWAAWAEEARAGYLAALEPPPERSEGFVDLGAVVRMLREQLPAEAILTSGAGNFALWPQRFYVFSAYGTQLGPTNGAMGYGLPAAVAAALRRPGVPVVCFAGDGDFLMTGQELATAVDRGAALVVLVVNNGMYGTIRMHQERAFPGRVVGTGLANPDFAAYARAFGAHGELVERTAQFAPAFERALAAGRPALLELRVDPESIAPGTRLAALRRAAAG